MMNEQTTNNYFQFCILEKTSLATFLEHHVQARIRNVSKQITIISYLEKYIFKTLTYILP